MHNSPEISCLKRIVKPKIEGSYEEIVQQLKSYVARLGRKLKTLNEQDDIDQVLNLIEHLSLEYSQFDLDFPSDRLLDYIISAPTTIYTLF